jgi:large subunit ribosomal protein L34e
MPRHALKSRSLARLKRVTPGGRVVTHYIRRRPKGAKCAMCKKPLSGVPRVRQAQLSKLPKSSRRPNRAYGGYLCPACLKAEIKQKIYTQIKE